MGTLVTLGVLALVVIAGIAILPRTGPAPINTLLTEEEVKEDLQKGIRRQRISIRSISTTGYLDEDKQEASPWLVMEVGQTTLDAPEGLGSGQIAVERQQALHMYSGSKFSSRSYYGGVVSNLAVMDKRSDEIQVVFGERLVVQNWSYASSEEDLSLYIETQRKLPSVEKDKDEILHRQIWTYSTEANALRSIDMGTLLFSSWLFPSDNNDLPYPIVFLAEDLDEDGKADLSEPIMPYRLDLESLQLQPIVSDELNDSLQSVLDGRT